MMTFISLLPFVLLMVLAQLGRRSSTMAVLTHVFLLFANLMGLLLGLALLWASRMPELMTAAPIQVGMDVIYIMGETLVVTSIVATVLMVPLVQRLLRLFMSIRPGDPVHTTALVFACYALGGTLVQAPLLESLKDLGTLTSLPPSELFGQALAFILLAFVGVGGGINRSWRDACARLGLAWPRRREWKVAISGTVALVIMQSALGAAWMAFSPQSAERVNELTQLLLGNFFNPVGAVLLGVAAGTSEELVFRGALQPRFGLLLTSVLFAFIHVQYALSFALVIIFLLALGLGIIRKRVNTTAAIIAHSLYNTILVIAAILVPSS